MILGMMRLATVLVIIVNSLGNTAVGRRHIWHVFLVIRIIGDAVKPSLDEPDIGSKELREWAQLEPDGLSHNMSVLLVLDPVED